MVTATLDGIVLAQSDRCEQVEGNYYFPPDAIAADHFVPTDTHTTCSWKGVASYYSIIANGKTLKDAAWYYPTPKDAARNIAGYVAFYKNVGIAIAAS